MSIFKKRILKICIILLGGIILFHIVFVSSKRYTVKLKSFKITNLSEKQYFSLVDHVRSSYAFIKSTKVNYLFDLPESTIYFIYSVYFFLFMAFVIFYSGSLFGRAKVKGILKRQSIPKAPPAPEMPRTKAGEIDLDKLLEQDPERAKKEFIKKLGTKDAVLYFDNLKTGLRESIVNLKESLSKSESPNEVISIKERIARLENSLKALSNDNDTRKWTRKN